MLVRILLILSQKVNHLNLNLLKKTFSLASPYVRSMTVTFSDIAELVELSRVLGFQRPRRNNLALYYPTINQ